MTKKRKTLRERAEAYADRGAIGADAIDKAITATDWLAGYRAAMRDVKREQYELAAVLRGCVAKLKENGLLPLGTPADVHAALDKFERKSR